jgi:hypothetical protein
MAYTVTLDGVAVASGSGTGFVPNDLGDFTIDFGGLFQGRVLRVTQTGMNQTYKWSVWELAPICE